MPSGSSSELRRGNTYDLIVMDPPAWGPGRRGEMGWRSRSASSSVRGGHRGSGGIGGHEHLLRPEPVFSGELWRAALPDAAIEAGELCLRSGTELLLTGSLVRVTRA